MRKIGAVGLLVLAVLLQGSSSLWAAISTPFCQEVEAIIFDCDGVLVDTEYLKFLAWKEALASTNVEFSVEEYMPLIGHSSKNILQMIRQLKNQDISDDVIPVRQEKYRLLQAQGVPPIAPMIEFARRLSQEKGKLGIKLGLASSASTKEIMHNLRQIGLEEAFDLVISGSDDLGQYVDSEGKNKPKPYIYIEAAKRLNVMPSRCVVFEDTSAGVEAASGAGMVAIAVPNQFTNAQDFSKATKVIQTYQDLPLKQIFKG
jgi:HAD superfamily hydrolase (TIGR01509 family)